MSAATSSSYLCFVRFFREIVISVGLLSGLIGFAYLVLPSLFPSLRDLFFGVEWLRLVFNDLTSMGPIARQLILVMCLSVVAKQIIFPWYRRQVDPENQPADLAGPDPEMSKFPAPSGLLQIGAFFLWCNVSLVFALIGPLGICMLLSSLFRHKELLQIAQPLL
jgi:hypothetical protein